MPTSKTWNGLVYSVPLTGEENWGGPTKVDGLLGALVDHGFQKTGGLFTLSADADLGATAGLKALYVKSRAASISSSGLIRMENAAVGIGWLNAAGNADLLLTVNSSNILTFNGVAVATAGGTATSLTALSVRDTAAAFDLAFASTSTSSALSANKTLTFDVANGNRTVRLAGDLTLAANFVTTPGNNVTLTTTGASNVTLPTTGTLATLAGSENLTNKTVTAGIFATSARFSYATASTVPYWDSNKDLVSSAVTPTELGYVSGVTSAIQTQMNLKAPLASPTFTGTVTLPSGNITSSAWTTGSSTLAVGGRLSMSSAGADTIFNIASGAGAFPTGTTQYGIALVPSFVASAATTEFNYYYVLPRSTSNSGTTARVHGFFADTAIKGGTDTWTRLINYRGAVQTAGTNNAFMADNVAFTGNWFINQSGTEASQFGGTVNISGGTLDIVTGSAGGGSVGAIRLSDITTNNTEKQAIFSMRAKLAAEENICLFYGTNFGADTNALYIGGGAGASYNALTNIYFYTAATSTTTGGTQVGSVANGLWTLGAASGTSTHVVNGHLSATFPTAGTIATMSITHSDNTNTGSHASLRAIVGGSSGGDARVHLIISGVRDWTMGIDNSDSDKLKIAPSSAVETNTAIEIDLSSNVTLGKDNTCVARLNNATQTTVGAAGGASALPATPTGYVEININGTARVIPYYAKS